MRIKSVNVLMKYLRDKKNISIGGQAQKLKLRQIGYYHGYKGYRFLTDLKILLPIPILMNYYLSMHLICS